MLRLPDWLGGRRPAHSSGKVVSWLWVPVAVIVAVQIVVPNIYFLSRCR